MPKFPTAFNRQIFHSMCFTIGMLIAGRESEGGWKRSFRSFQDSFFPREDRC
jgi:hypothetical protein